MDQCECIRTLYDALSTATNVTSMLGVILDDFLDKFHHFQLKTGTFGNG